MRREKDGVRRHTWISDVWSQYAKESSAWCFLPPSPDATSRKPGVELLNAQHWLWFKHPHFPFFFRILSYFLFFPTPSFQNLFHPFVISFSSSSVGGGGRQGVCSGPASLRCVTRDSFTKQKASAKGYKGKGPSQNDWGILEEGSQNRLPAGPLNPFALG